jgi:hypothetical protein
MTVRVVRPVAAAGSQIGFDSVFLPGGIPQHLTALANALIRLDMGTGRHFLQKHLDWLRTGFAFEGKETGWLGWHGIGCE